LVLDGKKTFFGTLCTILHKQARQELESAVANILSKGEMPTSSTFSSASVVSINGNATKEESPTIKPGAKLTVKIIEEEEEDKTWGSETRFLLVKYKPETEPNGTPFLMDHNIINKDTKTLTLDLPGFPGTYEISSYQLVCNQLKQSPKPKLVVKVETHAVLKTDDFVKMASRASSTWSNRLAVLNDLQGVFKTFGPNLSKLKQIPILRLKPPVWWWESQPHDKSLLCAFYKHGFGQILKLKDDATLNFSGPAFEQLVQKKQSANIPLELDKLKSEQKENFDANLATQKAKTLYALDSFPSASLLNKRCIRVLRAINTASDAYLRGEAARTLQFSVPSGVTQPTMPKVKHSPVSLNGGSKPSPNTKKKQTKLKLTKVDTKKRKSITIKKKSSNPKQKTDADNDDDEPSFDDEDSDDGDANAKSDSDKDVEMTDVKEEESVEPSSD